MSVLACDRRRCENIMCDRLILNRTHYICEDCWTELLRYKDTWPPTMTSGQMEMKIRDFMDSPPGTHLPVEDIDMEVEFRKLTGQYDWGD